MIELFYTIIYEPIFNAVLFMLKALPNHDMGLAIIIVTLAVKVVLYVPSLSAIRSSRQLQALQPRMKELQQRFKNNKEQLAKEQMKLYRESKVNPLSSCLGPLIQLPILIALYQVFFNGLQLDVQGYLKDEQLKHVYTSLQQYITSAPLNTSLLGFVDLAKTHNIILAVLAGAATFWQTRMLATPKEPKISQAKDESMTSAMNRQMQYIFPFITAIFSYQFAAGLALYWLVSTLFTVGQQYIFLKRHPLKPATVPTLPEDSV